MKKQTPFRPFFVAVLASACFLASCTTERGIRTVKPVFHDARLDAWAEDIDDLARNLPVLHKNLFFRISRESFRDEIIKLDADLPTLSDAAIKTRLRAIVASVGDGHTILESDPVRLLPIAPYWFEDGIIVVNAPAGHPNLVGARLVSIEGVPIEEAANLASTLIPEGNEASRKGDTPAILLDPEALVGLGIVPADRADEVVSGKAPIRLVFEKDGEKIQTELSPVQAEEYRTLRWAVARPSDADLPLYRRHSELAFWSEYLEKRRLLYVKYNSCSDGPNGTAKDFFEGVAKKVRDGSVDALVIDLRDNGGGDSSLMDPFIAELETLPVNATGRLWVVIGRATFSSAILNAMAIRNTTAAILIGEPTGGKPNHYGEIKSFSLPNSGLRCQYSTKYFRTSDRDPNTIEPDVKEGLVSSDYFALRDPCLERILADTSAPRN
jgi:hypothetical protein